MVIRIRKQPTDVGADYNAFGRDPDGRLAYLAAIFYGPLWVPRFTPQQFAGPPAPPRYGPPAQYQLQSLPEGFTPNIPLHFPNARYVFTSIDTDSYLDPPAIFDHTVFNALKYASRFLPSKATIHYKGCKEKLTKFRLDHCKHFSGSC